MGSVVKVPNASRRLHPHLMGHFLSCAALVAALTIAADKPAHAHPENVPAFVNRYLTLSPIGNHLEVNVVLLFGTVPATEQRREIDRDGDQGISEAELAAEKQRWTSRAPNLLALTVDGKPGQPKFVVEIDLNGRMAANGEPLLIQMRGQLPLEPGEHRLMLEAGADLPRMGETEMVLDAGHPWLLQAGLSPGGQNVPAQATVKYPGPRAEPGEPRHAGFVVRSHGPLDAAAPVPSIAMPAVLVGFSILLGAVLMWLVRRADRGRRS